MAWRRRMTAMLPTGAPVNQRLLLLVDGVAALLVAHAEFDARSLNGVDDGIAVFQRQRHRLLQQDNACPLRPRR